MLTSIVHVLILTVGGGIALAGLWHRNAPVGRWRAVRPR